MNAMACLEVISGLEAGLKELKNRSPAKCLKQIRNLKVPREWPPIRLAEAHELTVQMMAEMVPLRGRQKQVKEIMLRIRPIYEMYSS